MSQSSFFRRAVLGVAIAVLGAGNVMVMAPVFAQNVIEEIVVTARKRAENLQDVPAAVSAYSAEQLKDRGIDNIVEIGRLTPNMTVNETNGLISGAMQIFIRGIGNDPGFDQGVGIYVDDVYLNRTSGSLIDVYDVERIEILKGPQGNLYGRNTIGGAVKYVSAEPGDERRVHFRSQGGLGRSSQDSCRRFWSARRGLGLGFGCFLQDGACGLPDQPIQRQPVRCPGHLVSTWHPRHAGHGLPAPETGGGLDAGSFGSLYSK